MTAVVLRGDAARLPLPDGSVDLIVTSPPYFGLRSYSDGGGHYDGQVGSEASPREYLAALAECTREWVRVLKPSGSIFVNLGDKYAGVGGSNDHGWCIESDSTRERRARVRVPLGKGRTDIAPKKSLMGLPWRYALACMDGLGLILRRDIIWHKPNGLPESVTDRCRSSHEYLFHFTVRPRYFAAVDEIREPASDYHRQGMADRGARGSTTKARAMLDTCNPLGKLPGSVWSIPSAPLVVPASLGVDHFAAYPPELCRRIILGWSPPGVCTACGEGRRPVVPQEVYAAAVTAAREAAGLTRAELAERAGCGANNVWDYEVGGHLPRGRAWENLAAALGIGLSRDEFVAQAEYVTTGSQDSELRRNAVRQGAARPYSERKIALRRQRQQACACPQPDAPTRPALVVDPFGGTGTTALVAAAYGRTGVTVDRSADYCRLARWRTRDPGERARALGVPKPPPVPDGQGSLFDDEEAV